MLLRAGRPPLPREHGGWAMLITPVAVALLASGPNPEGLLAVLGWFAAYMLRGPVEALIGRGPTGRSGLAQAEPPVARFWLLLFGALAVAFLMPVVLARPAVLILLAGAAAILAIVWCLALRGETRSLWAGCLAATGLMAGGPLYYLAATGSVPPSGWALTYGCLAFFTGSVFRVKARARERRHAAFRLVSLAVHLLFVLGAAAAAALGWASPLLAVSLLPALGMTAYGVWQARHGRATNLATIGKEEVWLTVLFALLLIPAVR